MNKPLLTTLFIASTSVLAHAEVSLSGNMAISSDYIWRGMTQNDGDPSIHGGFDLEDDSGFYLGTWAANTGIEDGGLELDYYGGYAGSIGDLGYDIGYMKFDYPSSDLDLDFAEVHLGLTFGSGLFGVYDDIDNLDASFKADYSHTNDWKASGASAYTASISAKSNYKNLTFHIEHKALSYKTPDMDDFNSNSIQLSYILGNGFATTLAYYDKVFNPASEIFGSASSIGLKYNSRNKNTSQTQCRPCVSYTE